MKTLKEAMSDTIEMYEFISQLKNENDTLRKENAKLLGSAGSPASYSVITETERNIIRVLKEFYAKNNFSDWRLPSVTDGDEIIPFSSFYNAVSRDILYGNALEDIGLKDIKEFFKDDIRNLYNEKVAKIKADKEEAKTEKEKEE